MWWSFCSPKGGLGTSTVASVVALELAKARPGTEVILADFCGDQPDLLGVDVRGHDGVTDWLAADNDVPVESLRNVLVGAPGGVRLLPAGKSSLRQAEPGRIVQLSSGFGLNAVVVADLGVVRGAPGSPRSLLAAAGSSTTVVVRACYLALRRASTLPVEFDTVIEVCEPGRSLNTLDVELVLGHPVSTRIRSDPAVARAVDAGLLGSRTPRHLRRSARALIGEVFGTEHPAASKHEVAS